jgi:hypothetical protein
MQSCQPVEISYQATTLNARLNIRTEQQTNANNKTQNSGVYKGVATLIEHSMTLFHQHKRKIE